MKTRMIVSVAQYAFVGGGIVGSELGRSTNRTMSPQSTRTRLGAQKRKGIMALRCEAMGAVLSAFSCWM